MKAIKYLLLGVLMIGFNAPASAQEDHKAVIDQITKTITSKSANTANEVKAVVKEYKKNPDVLVAIGRAYLDIKDTANAAKYAEMARMRDKNYAPAYILKGDIEVFKDDGGEASAWYEQATYFDPKNPEGYRKYAIVNSKASPANSVAKLEELRKQLPDYPVDIISAEIYDKAGNLTKALEYYDKVDKSKMADYQLAAYAVDNFLKGNFEKSLEVSQYGNQKFPRNAALNRISFFDLTNLKRYPEALQYADRLLNASDSVKITEADYLYYGHALKGNKEYQKAIDSFNKSMELNKDNEDDRNDALKNIAEAYQELGDFANATEVYDRYLKGLKQITALDLNTLATMYTTQAEGKTGDEQRSLLNKADEVYGRIADNFPSAADFATLQRAHIGYQLDPESTAGTAKPHYEKLIEIINGHATKSERDNARLIEAYRYLGAYYLLVQKDKDAAEPYWKKILELDPNNEVAKQALGEQ